MLRSVEFDVPERNAKSDVSERKIGAPERK